LAEKRPAKISPINVVLHHVNIVTPQVSLIF
jgi:hypothetical protein